jgi:NADH-quinone oxidoreductase subunit N
VTLIDIGNGLAPLQADLLLVVGMFAVLIADIAMPAGEKRVLGWATVATLVVALIGTFALDVHGTALSGAYVGDGVAMFFKRVFLLGAAVAVLGSLDAVARDFPRRQGEYWLMLLSSVLGMTLLAGARNLILLVVSFELMGLPLYVLAAFPRRDRRASEGALKLLMTGVVSTALTLYGISLLSGLASTTSIDGVAAYVTGNPNPLVTLAAIVAVGGMLFKIGVFPFHMWVPDTYQGSSTPFVAFLSSAPKAAGLIALVQVLLARDHALLDSAYLPLLAIATATLVMGNLLAIRQDHIKRLFAYSGVAHMGFALVALSLGTAEGLSTLLFYVAVYVFTSIGAFLVVHAVRQGGGGDDTLASFDGLGRRNGWLALAMLTFLLSLGGIPFVAGFWAKLYVFMAAWAGGLAWFVVLGALISVLALFYYMRVARAMYMQPTPEGAGPIEVDFSTNVGIALSLAVVVGLGLYPTPVIESAQRAAEWFLH